ncbi:MAG TPA: hypothetical protein VD997_05160 [Phycisphaerales bacterium]|nr:hypothetical protein [Phycisphaerales bacterium]
MGPVWTLAIILTAIGLLALLHFMAAGLRDVTYIHDMRVRVGTLRKERLDRLQRMASQEIVEVGEAEDNRKAA